MNEHTLLERAGLTDTQAKIYLSLLKNGKQTPNELSKSTNLSRENCYAITKKLVELNLIEQTKDKKATFKALNPSNLETFVENRRKRIVADEKIVKTNISFLLNTFYANNQAPGSRTLEGLEGIKEAYLDTLRVKKDIYFLRTFADSRLGGDYKDESFLHWYRNQRPILGIHTYALTPLDQGAIRNLKLGRDAAINFHRTWMPKDDYTAPVEFDVYGDKISIISFTDESPMATIITSPDIAEALRQMLKLLINFYKKSYPQDIETLKKHLEKNKN